VMHVSNNSCTLCTFAVAGKALFTRNPAELQGTMVTTAVQKSARGFGFTIIGGDEPEEFLQVKSLVPDGPAASLGTVQTGDVIVAVNGTCVLGHTHAEVVRVFQAVPIGQAVRLQMCRGYPLPCEAEEMSISVGMHDVALLGEGMEHKDGGNHTSQASTSGSPRDSLGLTPPEVGIPEVLSIRIVKGTLGFGFTITDTLSGQRVKQILDGPRCRGLCQADLLLEVNGVPVRARSHSHVVELLKECSPGAEVSLLIQRDGELVMSAGTTITMLDKQENQTSTALQHICIVTCLTCHVCVSDLVYENLEVFLQRQESGFGFRILGGEQPGDPIFIGAVVPMGAAAREGRLRPGDELRAVDGTAVAGASHRHVVALMQQAARNGHVHLALRRPAPGEPSVSWPGLVSRGHGHRVRHGGPMENPIAWQESEAQKSLTYEVTLERKENEGFGFVIVSSLSRPEAGTVVGRIISGSPAERCGQLHVSDRILGVNGTSLEGLSHAAVIQLIRDSGTMVTLCVGPPTEPARTTAPASKEQPVDNTQCGQDNRSEVKARQDIVPEPTQNLQATQEGELYGVELEQGSRGYGFSLRGGREYGLHLFILRLAEDGPASRTGKLRVGDQIVEINGESAEAMTHARAIELIRNSCGRARLILRRGSGLVPDYGGPPILYMSIFIFNSLPLIV
uniref:PDZ domain-containing protein n=1 Tax=Eptatretus burgeri TaxID=7764 RepID=A0A8C4Q2M7_EPTBU